VPTFTYRYASFEEVESVHREEDSQRNAIYIADLILIERASQAHGD
jgi:hypothetical protein